MQPLQRMVELIIYALLMIILFVFRVIPWKCQVTNYYSPEIRDVCRQMEKKAERGERDEEYV